MAESDERLELRLGLGSGFGQCQPSDSCLDLNLMAPVASSQALQKNQNQNSNWNELLQSSDKATEVRMIPLGIDMNQAPSMEDCDNEKGVPSPKSTISSICGKRTEREKVNQENEAERASCSRESDEEDGSRKKLRLSKEQSVVLEESFKEHNTLNPKQKLALAQQLNLRPRQVEVWFQNRRARTKLKQTEVDCDYLKQCCENLSEENRRLQKEIQELRALKFSPQHYMHMNPPTTLTMCPSCERTAVAPHSSSSNLAAASFAYAPTGVNKRNSGSNPHRAIPISPFALLSNNHQQVDPPQALPVRPLALLPNSHRPVNASALLL